MEKNIDWISEQIESSSQVFQQIIPCCAKDILSVSVAIVKALNSGNKVLWCGNGGSAGQAQHLSAELVCGLRSHDRKALPSISLTTDTSLITAWSNDVGYNTIFSRQIEAIGVEGDILMALSTSGNSQNVIEAINMANRKGLATVGLVGDKECQVNKICNYIISIPSSDTQRIQESHILVGHIICEIIEKHFIESKPSIST